MDIQTIIEVIGVVSVGIIGMAIAIFEGKGYFTK